MFSANVIGDSAANAARPSFVQSDAPPRKSIANCSLMSASTPLLILSDTGDQRVPIAQSYALYHALRDRGRTVKFVAFPRAGHFPTDPVGRETALRQWAGWFDEWMK